MTVKRRTICGKVNCPRCGGLRDSKQSYCRECRAAYAKAYYWDHPGYRREKPRHAMRMRKRRLFVAALKAVAK